MKITEISVNRPAAVVMAIVLIVGLGYLGYTSLGANLFPAIDIPVMTVTTSYSGAGVEEIQNSIIKPIENSLAGIKGLDTMNSTANIGFASTVLRFTMETNMDSAFADVSQAVSDAGRSLPKDASKPSIRKLDMNSMPVLTLTMTGDVPYDVMYNYADTTKTMLEKIPGVGNVVLGGVVKKQVMINVDKLKLDFYNVSINNITNKLLSENMNVPAGEIEKSDSYETIRVLGEFKSVDEIKNVRIATANGGEIVLSELAEVKMDYPEVKQFMRFNGVKTISITVQKQSDANIVKTADAVKVELERINTKYKGYVKISIANDASKFITSTLSEVNKNLLEAILTTSLVLFFFMRHFRSSIIVLISIPASLAGTFFMMYIFGFTLNIMTLLALSLCIGILVDDSIVVLENIQRHFKYEKNPLKAAIMGRKEIGMAAIAITLSDVVIFAPIAFVSGMIGKYFREFGLTVVFAALFSLLVSFTITPMLAARFIKRTNIKDLAPDDELDKLYNVASDDEEPESKPGKLNFVKTFYERISAGYHTFLLWALDNRWKVIGVVFGLLIIGACMFPLGLIGAEFTPSSDQSMLQVNLTLNPGADVNQTNQKVKPIEDYLKTITEIRDFFVTIGDSSSNQMMQGGANTAKAQIVVLLREKNQRKRSQTEIANQLRKFCKGLTGANVVVVEPSYGGGGETGKPLAVNIVGNDYQVLKEISAKFEEDIKKISGVIDVGSSVETSNTEMNLKLDKLALSDSGIAITDVSNTLRTAVNGATAGVFRKNGDDYDIVVKLVKGQVQTENQMGSLKIMSPTGKQVFLSDIAKISIVDSPTQINRKDRQAVVTVSANITDRKLGDITKDVQTLITNFNLPDGYKFTLGADQQNMNDAFSALFKALIASILLVYMILVVLYESYLTPLIRMLSLPCGIIGAIFAMAITGTTINIMSLIAIIMLDGLASKNGTLLIDYTNTLMKTKGLPLREALIGAGTRRLRPIIMTSLTMVVGMLPSALSTGDGTELKKGMAIVLIGGIITSTILSPILLPVVYTLIDDFKIKLKLKRKNERVGETV